LKLPSVESFEIIRVGKIEAAGEQSVKVGILDLAIVEQVLDGSLPPELGKVLYLSRAAAKSHSP
jgi:hypothetical protein